MAKFLCAIHIATAILLSSWAGCAAAETPIVLFKSFAGEINFTGTEKTLRTAANGTDACSVTDKATMTLSGIPAKATVLNAQLYWAGSGPTGDYTITLDGASLSAPSNRQYVSGKAVRPYFAGAIDVTEQVGKKRNAQYAVGGLSVETGGTYCTSEAVLAGFQLLVVYRLPGETFRVLNLYEGLQYIQNSAVELTLANFLIPSPLDAATTARVGHITWEGDATLGNDGENLIYNGVAMKDDYNKVGNQFNSVSSINGDNYSYGIDFDAYTVKSPVIAAGQSSARTRYESGQDLVLMNAEIIAAPNVPATDRAIAMTLDAPLVASKETSYTIRVTNFGPLTESKLVVTDIVPGSLVINSVQGTNWTCGVSGQKVTCTYKLAAAANTPATALEPIVLKVTPAKDIQGLVTNSATVGGVLFDYIDGNNTATVTARTGTADFVPVFVFTDKECVHNKPFGDAAQPCKPVALDASLANTDLFMYITYVANNIPTAIATADTSLPMRFGVSCINPLTGNVKSTFDTRNGVLALPVCVSNGAVPKAASSWSSAADIVFAGNKPSTKTNFVFRYADVGRIELFVTDNAGRLGTTDSFVSRPQSLMLVASGNQAGTPASATDPKFVAAGAPFTMTVQAMMPGLTTPARNFGRETDPVKIVFKATVANAADGAPIDGMVVGVDPDRYYDPLEFRGSFNAFVDGVATGNQFAFDDVGVIQLVAHIDGDNYLGSGDVFGSANVGRFVPHHFDTVVAGKVACRPAAACPNPAQDTPPLLKIATMAYSGQPFSATVNAIGANGNVLKNYRADLARNVRLLAYQAPNGTVEQKSPTVPGAAGQSSVLGANTVTAAAFKDGVAVLAPTYTFPAALAYVGTAPGANNWALPVSAYLRAVESSGTDNTTSQRSDAVEGGVQVVSGRMWVPNAKGAAQLAMNIEIKPQFFGTLNGTNGWYDSGGDSSTTFAPMADVKFSECKKLAGAPSCKLPLAVDKTTAGAIAGGIGIVKLTAPGDGSSGSAQMWLEHLPWLPSVYGTLTYGTFRSQYIYLREIY